MLERLRVQVCQTHPDLVRTGLVFATWGNASGLDRERGLMVIKPSGVPDAGLKPRHMVVVSLHNGKVVEGNLKPSSDSDTHRVLYRAFPEIGGVIHTHSLYATAWAQAHRGLPAFGTTQADDWYGGVPSTRRLTPAEIKSNYEANTGRVIVQTFRNQKLDPMLQPAVLVARHGPFTWGKNVADAFHHAGALEFVARRASESLRRNPRLKSIPSALLAKHFLRKHGPNATYGQP